jgi:ubiquinone/menaquinone biosynthesis C-methylase UbiE
MNKSSVSKILRKLGLIYYSDRLMFHIQKQKNKKINNEFLSKNPGVVLPPDYLIYESFQINYQKYYFESRETALWLKGYFEKYIDVENNNILDWGCGPGRVIRHLPEVIGKNCRFFGTDYNCESIEWCKTNLKTISFNLNPLSAELPYSDGFMDIIYGISVFTHLSEQMHYSWYKELTRVLKPGGIILVTTQGDNFKVKLTEPELKEYNNGNIVVRGNVKEGHRTFSAFHPEKFMKSLFRNDEILEHVEKKPELGMSWLPQDLWIVRKR